MSEATALPTEPQPLPIEMIVSISKKESVESAKVLNRSCVISVTTKKLPNDTPRKMKDFDTLQNYP